MNYVHTAAAVCVLLLLVVLLFSLCWEKSKEAITDPWLDQNLFNWHRTLFLPKSFRLFLYLPSILLASLPSFFCVFFPSFFCLLLPSYFCLFLPSFVSSFLPSCPPSLLACFLVSFFSFSLTAPFFKSFFFFPFLLLSFLLFLLLSHPCLPCRLSSVCTSFFTKSFFSYLHLTASIFVSLSFSHFFPVSYRAYLGLCLSMYWSIYPSACLFLSCWVSLSMSICPVHLYLSLYLSSFRCILSRFLLRCYGIIMLITQSDTCIKTEGGMCWNPVPLTQWFPLPPLTITTTFTKSSCFTRLSPRVPVSRRCPWQRPADWERSFYWSTPIARPSSPAHKNAPTSTMAAAEQTTAKIKRIHSINRFFTTVVPPPFQSLFRSVPSRSSTLQ